MNDQKNWKEKASVLRDEVGEYVCPQAVNAFSDVYLPKLKGNMHGVRL